MLVEEGKEELFRQYVEGEEEKTMHWLDTTEALRGFEDRAGEI